MKKIYSLLLLTVTSLSFGQILTDDFNYPDNSLLTANGWTAHNAGGTNPIDVGASNGLLYAGYNTVAGNAAKLDNTGEDVNKAFGTPITSGTIYFSFLVNVSASTPAAGGYFASLGSGATTFYSRVYVRPSATAGKINFGIGNNAATYSTTDFDLNTTYLIIVKYDVSATGPVSLWVESAGVPASEVSAGIPEATSSGSGNANVAGFYLRQFDAGQNITVDEVKVYTTWFGTAPCPLTLNTETATCNASTLNIDTYNVTIPFTGGNSGTYNLSTGGVGTIGGANPSTTAEGDIVISNVPEGTGFTLTVTGGCTITRLVVSPECKPILPLPLYENFDYAVGTSLASTQRWSNATSGDTVDVVSGSLTYPNYPSSANAVSYLGGGSDPFTRFTTTTSGTVYTSFLLNVTDMASVTDLSETVIAAVTGDASGTFRLRLFFKKNGTQYQLGCTAATTTTAATFDATLLNTGTVVAVVIGYDFAANQLKMWLNPDFSTFTSATPASITETPTVTAPATSLANLGGFLLRQADNATPAITFDELRIAETTTQLLSSSSFNAIAGLKIYPNPSKNGVVFIETATNAERTIAFYNVLGKQVLNTTTSESAVNVSNLQQGVYIVKITEEGKTATRKVVIE
jgi:hypothetical protein